MSVGSSDPRLSWQAGSAELPAAEASQRTRSSAPDWSRHEAQPHGRIAGLDRSLVYVAILSTLLGLAALYWFYQHDLVLGYTDAVSHLNIARRVLDSRTPGIAQLGTVWLPVPHLLLQPFIYSDYLWRTGLAGSVVSLLCFVATAVALFSSVRLITERQSAAWIGLAVFLLNANVLYLQTTALTEPVLLASMTGSGYYFLRWGKRGNYGSLILAGLLAALAVGSRYEGWFFALACGGLLLVTEYRRTGNAVRSEGVTLAYVVLPVYVMFMWFYYNAVIFGDPLAFARGEYSAAFQQEQISRAVGLPTQHNVVLSTMAYTWAVIDDLGLPITVLGLVAIAVYLLGTRLRSDSLAPYAFLSAYPFNILSLWLGQTVIATPQSEPSGYFNIRYGIVVLPGVALFVGWLSGVIIKRFGRIPALTVFWLVLVLQFGLWLPGWPRSIITVVDGLGGSSAPPARLAAADYLHANYGGGGVLIDDTNSRFIMESGLAFREYIGAFSDKLWRETLTHPTEHVEWIVLHPAAPDDRVASEINQTELASRYRVAFEQDGLAVYRLIPSSQSSGGTTSSGQGPSATSGGDNSMTPPAGDGPASH